MKTLLLSILLFGSNSFAAPVNGVLAGVYRDANNPSIAKSDLLTVGDSTVQLYYYPRNSSTPEFDHLMMDSNGDVFLLRPNQANLHIGRGTETSGYQSIPFVFDENFPVQASVRTGSAFPACNFEDGVHCHLYHTTKAEVRFLLPSGTIVYSGNWAN